MLTVGDRLPDFRVQAVVSNEKGKEFKEVSNKDNAGKWLVLFFWPKDFTFVCPTEIKGFQELLREFADEGVEVIGVSTDSFYSHKQWFADRKTFPNEITHPVIGDTNHAVSRA